MSVTNVLNTRNASFEDYSREKFLLGDNEFASAEYTDSGAGSTLNAHLVVAKIAATGKLVAWDPTASTGAEEPVGLLWLGGSTSVAVTAAATKSMEYVNKGKINKNLIAFPDAQTLATVYKTGSTIRLEDRLAQIGLVLEDGIELTGVDNS